MRVLERELIDQGINKGEDFKYIFISKALINECFIMNHSSIEWF